MLGVFAFKLFLVENSTTLLDACFTCSALHIYIFFVCFNCGVHFLHFVSAIVLAFILSHGLHLMCWTWAKPFQFQIILPLSLALFKIVYFHLHGSLCLWVCCYLSDVEQDKILYPKIDVMNPLKAKSYAMVCVWPTETGFNVASRLYTNVVWNTPWMFAAKFDLNSVKEKIK